MDFIRLLKIQSGLDNYIGEAKEIEIENYSLERNIALQVEFNELLNECPFIFKYWSNKEFDRYAALEEYADTLHFLLSVGNDFGIKKYKYRAPKIRDMRLMALGINNMISRLRKETYAELVHHILLFGQQLGFTSEEIEDAYMEKNKVNYQRQQEGY